MEAMLWGIENAALKMQHVQIQTIEKLKNNNDVCWTGIKREEKYWFHLGYNHLILFGVFICKLLTLLWLYI